MTKGLLPGNGEHGGQSLQKVGEPRSEVRLCSSFVIVMVRMGGERPVVGREIQGVPLLQREETVQSIPAPMQEKSRQKPGGAAVAVVVGMDGDELVMGQTRDDGKRQAVRLSLSDPPDQRAHQIRRALRLGWEVDNGPGLRVPDHVLPIPVRSRAGSAATLHEPVQTLDQRLGQLGPLSGPFLDPQQCVPVIPDLSRITFPAAQVNASAFDHLLGLRQGQPIAFDTRGLMGGAKACLPAQLRLHRRWERDVLHDSPRRLDLHQAAGDRRGQGIAWLPVHSFHSRRPAWRAWEISADD